jgi:enamine deaminase RidA (YjgF/YER057c/UK114 family)
MLLIPELAMPRFLNPPNVPQPSSHYSQGVLTGPCSKRLFISGQVGMGADKALAQGLEAQAELAFDNLFAIIAAAEMTLADLVKLTVYCAVPGSIGIIRQVRTRKLGRHAPASTYLEVAGLANPSYLVEIEGEAVRETL